MTILKPDNPIIISTGSLILDIALGKGGIPGGSIVEILGPSSSGKTSLCLSILAEAAKLGEYCAFIDADQSLTITQLRTFGVDLQQTFVAQTSQAEQALGIMEHLIRSQAIRIIVLDSIDSLVPMAESASKFSDETTNPVDKLFSNFLSKINPILRRSQTILLLTRSQPAPNKTVYHKLSQNTARLATKLHASILMQLESPSNLVENKHSSGWRVLVNLKKNKFGPCPRTIKLDIMYNDGILKVGEIFDLGLQLQIIKNLPGRYLYQSQVLGNSKQESLDFLKSSLLVSRKIEEEIRQIIFS